MDERPQAFITITIRVIVILNHHWILCFLTLAMYPRFLNTLNEELAGVSVTVRVEQVVDVVGQADKPRTISGFQTYQAPVRLGTKRAEIVTEEYLPFAGSGVVRVCDSPKEPWLGNTGHDGVVKLNIKDLQTAVLRRGWGS